MLRDRLQHPTRLIPLSFLVASLVGTLLLMLPAASASGVSAPPLVALFTAVSAVCVTGLVTVDTATYWSGFGQAVILLLFQIGGLGIMSGAVLLGLLVTRRLRLRNRLLAQSEIQSLGLGEVVGVFRVIVLVTLSVELVVAALLTLELHFGFAEPWWQALWNGVFHAVSAYNNAGFSTYSDGLVRFASQPVVLLALMAALVIGGLGFPVLHELLQPERNRPWTIHTRITLFGSFLLLLLGTVGLLGYEWNNPATLGPLGFGDKLLVAAFQSASARTAGFNAVDIGQLRVESLVLHYMLMFIGGGSAGTAGGIKVTTFFLLFYVVWAEIRGNVDTSAFGRRVSLETQRQALSVVLLSTWVVAAGILLLLTLTDLPLVPVAFEAISAFATVGLSTGITGDLPPAAQLVVIALMFIGRVGTITLATGLALRSRSKPYRYPEERPLVG